MTANGDRLGAGRSSARWELVPVEDVQVNTRQRPLVAEHVAELRSSFARLGGQIQLQPIVVAKDLTSPGGLVLVDGFHRLTAAKEDGWTHIAAMVFDGLSMVDVRLLESEANMLTRELTPLQRHEAWVSVYQPAHKTRAAINQGAGLVLEGDGRRTKQFGNAAGNPTLGSTPPALSERALVSQAAKQATGLSIETLKRIGEIRAVADDESQPKALRKRAALGVAKLDVPGAKVAPIYNEIRRAVSFAAQTARTREEQRFQVAEANLDRTVRDVTLLAQRLASAGYAETLAAAAQNNYLAGEQLRGVRVALTQSLALVAAIECALTQSGQQDLMSVERQINDLIRAALHNRSVSVSSDPLLANAAL